MHHLDELLDHLLGDDKVGNHTVFHRADGFDVAGHLAEHRLGFAAHSLNHFFSVGTAFMANGHHRRLVQHNTLVAGKDQGVGGAQINRQVGGKVPTKCFKHVQKSGWRHGQTSLPHRILLLIRRVERGLRESGLRNLLAARKKRLKNAFRLDFTPKAG